MKRTVALELLCYGILIAGLSFCARFLAREETQVAVLTGLVGSACCLVFALKGVVGTCRKALPVLTLAALAFLFLSQTVIIWADEAHKGPAHLKSAIVVTLLFLTTVAMLTRVIYSGLAEPGDKTVASTTAKSSTETARQSSAVDNVKTAASVKSVKNR